MSSAPKVCISGCIRQGPRRYDPSRASSNNSSGARDAPASVRQLLRVERAAAAAATRRIRIREGEARALHRRHVVDRHAVEILGGEGVDEHLEPFLLDDEIIVSRLLLDQQTVFEAAAATGLHAHTKSAACLDDAFLLHESLDLDRCRRRYGYGDGGFLGGGHGYLNNV